MHYLFVISCFYVGFHQTLQVLLLVTFLSLTFRKIRLIYFIVLTILLCSVLFGSIYQRENLSNMVLIRDLVYFSVIPIIAFISQDNKIKILAALNKVAHMHAFFIICISVTVSIFFFTNFDLYLAVRFFSLSNGFGDIWTSGSGFVRVQILGNPLLLIAALVNLYEWALRDKKISILLVVGVFVAGNLSFVGIYSLVASICMALKLRNNCYRLNQLGIIIAVAVICVVYYLVPLGWDFFLSKFDGEVSSLGHRAVLVDLFTQQFKTSNIFIGNGAGFQFKMLKENTTVNYIELQSLLLILKFGVVIFLAWHILILVGFSKSFGNYAMYFAYVFASSANPYMFDTNQLVAVIVFSSLTATTQRLIKT